MHQMSSACQRRSFARLIISPNVCTNSATSTSHVFGLDGFRGVAVLLVFLGHYGVMRPGPALGVQIFFVISGFIITRTLWAEYEDTGSIDIPRFYMLRF